MKKNQADTTRRSQSAGVEHKKEARAMVGQTTAKKRTETKTTPVKGVKKKGCEIVIDALEREGVEVVFGYPGGAIIDVFDQINQSDKFEFILVRHEQGAIHMAEGYARATGKVGVCLVTSGPGATNTVTGLADALMD